MTPLGRYRIGARLGAGGSADVFAAELIDGGGRPLAIKRLRRELFGPADVAAAFAAELALARRLHHGGIAQLFDHGTDADGAPYLVMERVDGISLDGLTAHLAATGDRLAVADALQIVIDACDALAYAHRLVGDDGAALGVVHRDVSPRNLLVSRDGVVKLVDFGIARVARGGAATLPGVVRGSLGYLAPEQYRGEPVDGRTDQYALGVVLFELVAGTNPLAVTELAAAGPALAAGLPPLPVAVDRVLGDPDPALAAIVARATAPALAERFATIDELGAALTEWRAVRGVRADRARLAAQVRAARGEVAVAVRALDHGLREVLPEPPGPVVAPARRRRARPVLVVTAAVAAAAAVATAVVVVRRGAVAARSAGTVAAMVDAGPADAGAAPGQAPAQRPDAAVAVDAAAPPGLAALAPPRHPDARATSTGRLKVNLVPYAVVRLDGRALGTTPLDVEVPAGRHRLELVNPASGRAATRPIVVAADGTTEVTAW
ncbi:MAG: serine/threonine-protein kinase [Kofleriaceae bacterium]